MKLDLLVSNARILTLNPARPRATSIGVWNGRIVGVDEDLSGVDARTHIDAGGAVITPGFHDSHNHTAAFGRLLQEIDAGALSSLDELYSAIASRHAELPPEQWILASGYDQSRLGGHPRRQVLDQIAPGRKIIVNHRTTHLLVASTPVFVEVGALSPDFVISDGGFIERDADGEATGLVGEQAMTPFRDLLRPHSIDNLAAAIVRAGERFLSEGITSVGEAGIGDSAVVGSSPIELAAYQRLSAEGRLPVRTQLMVAMENLHAVGSSPADGIELGLDLGIHSGFGDDMLELGPIKMFTDGALMSRTAALTADFCDHPGAGMMQFDREYLIERATQAHRGGWQLAVHAIGDHAVDIALDTIEAAIASGPPRDHRHRMEHASVVRPDQLERMVTLGVIPSPQPRFVYELGDSVALGLGPERVPWTYRHASFLAAGLTVPAGSDRPVVAGAPLPAMQSMVDRLTRSGAPFNPEEAVSAEEALRAYTVGSAYAARQEHKKGSLRPRMLADFVVLDADPTAVPTPEIGEISVLATVVGGEARFDPEGRFG